MSALHFIAASAGIHHGGGCACSLCGHSPFDVGKKTTKSIPLHFPRPDLVDRSKEWVCAGCIKIVGGKASKTDPPLRMFSWLALGDRLVALEKPDIWDALRHRSGLPTSGHCVISYAASKRKHHGLYARLTEPGGPIMLGTDEALEVVHPAQHGQIMDVVTDLREKFTPDEISAADYHPSKIRAMGAAKWSRLEAVIAPLRALRPSLVEIFANLAPKPESTTDIEEESMLSDADRLAIDILADIAQGSHLRQTDGLAFWKGTYLHRVRRFARLPLPDLVSRLMQDLGVSSMTVKPGQVVGTLPEDTASEVEAAIRDRADLLVSLAFDRIKTAREDKS